MRNLLVLGLVFFGLCFASGFALAQSEKGESVVSGANDISALRALPIQDGGRIKPLDTFARETLALVYGKESFEGRPALDVVYTWLLQPQAWESRPLFEIRYNLVKKALHFSETDRYFSLKDILENERLSMLMQELQSKREAKAKLDPYYQALQRLEGQVGVFRGIASGELLRLVPPAEVVGQASIPGMPKQSWLGMGQWTADQQQAFALITKAFVRHLASQVPSSGAVVTESPVEMSTAVEQFVRLARAQSPQLYPDTKAQQLEVFYNDFHPFQKAWGLYFLAALSVVLVWVLRKPIFYPLSWGLALFGLLLHIYGFAVRVYLSGRAPVSNMYETVIWVGFGAVVFAIVIEAIYRWRFVLLAGSIVGGFCLLLADNAPLILDPSLQPLQAVLNSNFWLTTHVLTITVSYAAFFLAFALGDIGLVLYLRGETEASPRLRAIVLSIYRAIQIGVALLAPGIILGGIWADYSWGRFWGWDPKETWALIALLGYIAVLHARIAGLLKGFGLVAASVVAFSLVIMAWYGVNYVLGAGLHSYGFGAGGVEYVATFVGLHLVAVAFVGGVYRTRQLKGT